jgi:dihydrofolate reductase
MGTVGAGFSISMDGFIAGENDDVSRVFAWMFAGDVDVKATTGDHDIDLKLTQESVEDRATLENTIGAVISGRRLFDVAHAWGGKHPLNVPVVVLTHNPPQEWVGKESIFTFVTEGVESAVAAAKKLAGGKNIGVAGANVARQCLKAGLLDELHFDMVPAVLGKGVALFEYMGIEPVEFDITQVKADKGVVHLTFRVKK